MHNFLPDGLKRDDPWLRNAWLTSRRTGEITISKISGFLIAAARLLESETLVDAEDASIFEMKEQASSTRCINLAIIKNFPVELPASMVELFHFFNRDTREHRTHESFDIYLHPQVIDVDWERECHHTRSEKVPLFEPPIRQDISLKVTR